MAPAKPPRIPSRSLSCRTADDHLQNTNHHLNAHSPVSPAATQPAPCSKNVQLLSTFEPDQSSTAPVFSGTPKFSNQNWAESYVDPSGEHRTDRETLTESFFDDRHGWAGGAGSPSRPQAYAIRDDTSNTPRWSEYVDYGEASYHDALKSIDISPEAILSTFESVHCFPGEQSYPSPSPEGRLDVSPLQPNFPPNCLLQDFQSTNQKALIQSSRADAVLPQEGKQLLLSERKSKYDAHKGSLTRSIFRQMPPERPQTTLPDSPSMTPPELKPQVSSLKRQPSSDEKEAKSKVRKCAKSSSSLKKGHSICEKRYRTKLNFKIAALRESIPHLHLLQKGPKKHDHDEEMADSKAGLDVSTSQAPSDKATIISKAIEYISFLEKANKRLTEEDRAMRGRGGEAERPVAAGSLVVRNGVIILRDCSILGV